MANLRQRKSPEQRIRGYKAEFRKTSKDGVFYERGIPPRHAKFFTFDNRDKDNVILRPGFTPANVLAAIGGEPSYKRDLDTRQAPKNRNMDKELERDSRKGEWYQTEKHTAALLRAILSSLSLNELSGDGIWNLLRLTWITVSKGHSARDHWKRLKVPALAALWGQQGTILKDLKTTLEAMQLPAAIKKAAVEPTGMVNFRNVWRNSSREWCVKNEKELKRLIHNALELEPNDQSRFDLAKKIDALPGIPSPRSARLKAGPAVILTPLVGCLDPGKRFPIINGREGVNRLLRALSLSNRSLEDQVKGMVNLIGQFGISDSFMLDVLADDLVAVASKMTVPPPSKKRTIATQSKDGRTLPTFDEAEREAVQRSTTLVYRNRHNIMTNALKKLFAKDKLVEGTEEHCRYDVIIKQYDETNRDLLIEVKPDPDKGSIRIAIGQLVDYRRFLPHRAGTDLALLTMSRPPQTYLDLMLELQISALWFDTERCQSLSGEGKVWEGLKAALL